MWLPGLQPHKPRLSHCSQSDTDRPVQRVIYANLLQSPKSISFVLRKKGFLRKSFIHVCKTIELLDPPIKKNFEGGEQSGRAWYFSHCSARKVVVRCIHSSNQDFIWSLMQKIVISNGKDVAREDHLVTVIFCPQMRYALSTSFPDCPMYACILLTKLSFKMASSDSK